MKLENTLRRLAGSAARLAKEYPKHAHLFSPEKRLTPVGEIACCIATCHRPLLAKGLCASHLHRINHCSFGLSPEKPIEKSQNKSGKLNGNWKGGIINDGHGRVLVYAPNHPNPNAFGTHVYRYRLVMEKRLGRFLIPGEIVHHKNGNKSDDKIKNLQLMTQSKHARIHHKNGRFA